jgi:hypothetical protein
MISKKKISFYCEDLSKPRPTPKLEDHPLSAVRDSTFSIFSGTLHTGRRSSVRNMRTRHTTLTVTHLSQLTAVITAHYFYKLKIIRTENISNKSKSAAKLSWPQTKPLLSLCMSLIYLTTAACHIP